MNNLVFELYLRLCGTTVEEREKVAGILKDIASELLEGEHIANATIKAYLNQHGQIIEEN